LTADGRQTVERVAAWAARMGLKVEEIRHSGKLRAEQTAAIFAQRLQPRRPAASCPGLAPHDDVRPVAQELSDCLCSVMIVGHLPFLARLAGLMLTGDPQRHVIRFQNGGLVGLAREEEKWTVSCVLPPGLPTG
jgi:phosphohistidine phosphatase